MANARSLLIIPLAIVAWRCSFSPDETTLFKQYPVPAFTMRTKIERSPGASINGTPRFALEYLLYFSEPAIRTLVPGAVVDSLPETVATRLTEVLPVQLLNRGFALGYGDFVLGVATLVVFDDLNNDGVRTDNEPFIGSSTDDIIVYFQGVPTQEIVDQFGALQQGYNLCVKTSTFNNVDLFQTIAPAAYTAHLWIPKAGTIVDLPRLR